MFHRKHHAQKVYLSESESADSDVSGNDASDEESANEDSEVTNAESSSAHQSSLKSGLANAIATVLGGKLTNPTRTILAKGKTDREIGKRKKDKEELEGESDVVVVKKEKLDEKSQKDSSVATSVKEERSREDLKEERRRRRELTIEKREQRRLWEQMGHSKPDALDKERERNLQRIATKGVVQLFNAVKQQQKSTEERLKSAGSVTHRRDKVLDSLSKGAFLDLLKGNAAGTGGKHVKNESDIAVKAETLEADEEPQSKWSALRDDFMMGASMKDWDQQSSDSGDDG